MKAAVIGIGVIGKVHLEVLAELNIRVTAVCDTDENKIKNSFNVVNPKVT